MKNITAIVVTYESQNLIKQCIDFAIDSGIAKISIWDNSPTSECRLLLADLKRSYADRCEILIGHDGTNQGFGGGVNKAVGATNDNNHILLLNPDCLITLKALSSMQSCLDESHGIVAPRMRYLDKSFGIAGGPAPSVIKEFAGLTRLDEVLPLSMRARLLKLFKSATSASLGDTLVPGEPIDVDWVSGFCALLTRESFDTVGGFDMDYFLYFEDVDICRRLRNQGFFVRIDRRAEALHFESTSTARAGKSAHYRRGLITYWKKHGSWQQRTASKILELTL